ncbi:MAG: DUF4249 domain-containing protein [Bacteroidales bacterium]|nr:DUF4249 domain-containing protein [Bacteroidales bacterium]MCF8405223.1 DUF4249 domain-containing protein [Bacteroidales bacterium]
MKNINQIFSLLIFVAVFSSCSERIEIELDPNDERLSVEGYITTDTMAHWVRLTRSKDYYSGNPVNHVSGATVTLSDGTESLVLAEDTDNPGYYRTASDYFGIPGRTYSLNINLDEEIGGVKDYYAECLLNPVGDIDSIQVVYNENWEGYEVRIYAWEPPTTNFYTFQVLKNGVLLNDTLNEVWISDDRYFNGNYTNGIMVGFLDANNPDEAPVTGDEITLKMSGITSEYYNFIFQLQDVTFEYRNPLFSGPPANVITNISDGTGFFSAYSTAYSSTIYQGQ